MGFRSLRLALDRPGLLRIQVRALAAGRRWRADEDPRADGHRRLGVPARPGCVNKLEVERLRRAGRPVPSKLELGAMIEVPSLLWELDQVLPEADFVSIGSNDLVMFLTAADRANPRVAKAYDPIALPRLRALRHIVDMAAPLQRAASPCAASWPARPVEALALMSIGMTRLSMSPPAIGPIKEMMLGLELEPIRKSGRRGAAAKAPAASASAICCWTGPSGRRSLI